MISLLFKELLQLRPVVLILFTAGLTILLYNVLVAGNFDGLEYRHFTVFFDANPDDDYRYLNSAFTLAINFPLVFLILFYSFQQESNQQTFSFLGALPLSSQTVFIVKILASWLTLVGCYALWLIVQNGFLWMNTATIDGRLYLDLDAFRLVLVAWGGFILLGYAVLLARLGAGGWVIAACLWAALLYQLVEEKPTLWFDQLYRVNWSGQTPSLSLSALLAHSLAAIVAMIAAYHLWVGRGFKAKVSRISERMIRLGQLLFLLGLVVTLLSATDNWLNYGNEVDWSQMENRDFKYFYARYKKSDEALINQLEEYAQEDYESLAQLLGKDSVIWFSADLSLPIDHALGLAAWRHVRIDTGAHDDLVELRHTLIHEMAHILQYSESNYAVGRYHNATVFFLEGMAEYAAYSVLPRPSLRKRGWHVAAVSWKRHNIDFGDLINSREFTKTHNRRLFYTLGDIWSDALSEICGTDALGNVLRVAGRAGAPHSLAGNEFWRHTLDQLGCDLAAVNHAWAERLRAIYKKNGDEVFPRFGESRLQYSQQQRALTVRVDVDASTDELSAARFALLIPNTEPRNSRKQRAYSGELHEQDGDLSAEFVIPESDLPKKNKLRLQFSYKPYDGISAYYAPWREHSFSRE